MRSKSLPVVCIAFILSTAFTGCSEKAPLADSKNDQLSTQEVLQTEIDIHYHLGHAHRRLWIHASPTDPTIWVAQVTVDGAVLKESKIDAKRGAGYISKIRDFVEKRRALASGAATASTDCHDRYQVSIKFPQTIQKDTLKAEGCRIQDEGSFSHLVNEGEFLIYH